jgi:uncharacterized protein YunC (DUF1805 family)
MDTPIVVDTATRLGPDAAGRVVVCGSHGGVYPASVLAKARVRAAISNDAGVGKEGAGIGGLYWLEKLGIAACTADHASARIGDGADTYENGKISHANKPAAALGVKAGMPCREAAAHLSRAHPYAGELPQLGETRMKVPASGHREVWAMDSITLSRPEDARAIVLSGTHGAVLGGKAEDGLVKVDVFAAFFNDAGGGKEGVGYSRLPTLDPRGIAAATVSSNTARIGDGRSTYESGVLSHVNAVGKRLGLEEGMTAREAVARLLGLA